MKNILFIILIFLAVGVSAQVVEENILDIDQVVLENDVTSQNSDVTIFRGNNNIVVLQQEGINSLNAYIRGNNNGLNLLQKGDYNYLRTSQNGNGNQVNSSVSGSYNTINITQNGNNNVFKQDLENISYSKFNFTQNGSNHHLIHIGEDKVAEGLEVKMSGNRMTILIETKN